MPTGTIRLHDVIQNSDSSLTRPPSPVTLDAGAVRLFLSPASFNDPGIYQAAIDDGDYTFRNANRRIERKLDNTRNSQAFFRIDTGSRLRRSLFRSNRINENDFRRMRNVNFDLFRINVNEDAYITREKVLAAMVVPEFVRTFLESLSIRVLGTNFDLVNEAEIERILGDIAGNINNFDVRITNNGRIRIHFRLRNIRINIPQTAANIGNSIIDILGGNGDPICEEYLIEELNINLFLKADPNRTVDVNDQIRFSFESVRLFIPNGVEVRGCPPATDRPNSDPNMGDWDELANEVEMTIRNLIRTTVSTAVAAALSPINNAFMRYVNIEMESEFDRMMGAVISETMQQYDELIDINAEDITSTINRFRIVRIRTIDENGDTVEFNALKPVLVYGVMTSSTRIPRISINTTIPRKTRF